MMGLANRFILGEHQAFNAFGLTENASALTSNVFGVSLTFGIDSSLILSVAAVRMEKIKHVFIQFIVCLKKKKIVPKIFYRDLK